ncbi:signal peptide peptidase SppA [Halorubellus sp. JP-L1]|uniref:signal peptide peptidase SppA n=1 Tax=Halorubellus sp. JP-L1 TaxID=2715753 RepID=UPI00140A0DB7|nr:signal peptide peptidase SppA [Halorubellus sp. JP-L1]NHN42448.1 signal peptide peptidase SppA [Halorubellus sp. JP-L1]
MVDARSVLRLGIVLLGALVGVVVGWWLFVGWGPDPLAVLLVLATAAVLVRVTGSIASSVLPGYNVAEVEVKGPITRDGGGGRLPSSPTSPGADEIVEQIERADDDGSVDALLVKLNTPGGEVVPSDDIRTAAKRFDGPTIAYTNDLCASGGYWIASGCDELWARDASLVGSIGVILGQVNAKELADKVGVQYEALTAGEYKDAGSPLKEFTDDDREYLQGLVDEWYDDFVERVADGRDMDPDAVRDTEAKVYLGETAHEIGLVDALGARDDVEDELERRLGTDVTVEAFRPQHGLGERLRGSAQAVAYAAGAGVGSVVANDDGPDFELR